MALKTKPMTVAKRKSSINDNLFDNTNDGLILNEDLKSAKDKLMLDYERVDLNEITVREDNRFELVNIESLAQSIDKIRLAQPIVLRQLKNTFRIHSGDESEEINNINYEIVAGHRRVAAYEMLLMKYKLTDDEERIDRYSKIPALILPEGSTQKEVDALYEMTNLETRNLDTTDILRHVDYYLDEIVTNDIEEKLINPKFRGTNKAKYIVEKFKNLNVSISLAQVKNYISVYENATKSLLKVFNKSYISLNNAIEITKKYNINKDNLAKKQDDFAAEIIAIEENSEWNSVIKTPTKRELISKYLDSSNDELEILEAIKELRQDKKEEQKLNAQKMNLELLCSSLVSIKNKINSISNVNQIFHVKKIIDDEGLIRLENDEETPLTQEEKELIIQAYSGLKDSLNTLESWVQDIQKKG